MTNELFQLNHSLNEVIENEVVTIFMIQNYRCRLNIRMKLYEANNLNFRKALYDL